MLQELLAGNEAAQQAVSAGDAVALLSILNTPTEQVRTVLGDGKPGFVSNASMAGALGQNGVAQFLAVLSGAIKLQRSSETAEGEAVALLLESFVARFNTTPDGLDFANEEIRAQVTGMLTQAQIDPEPYMALGYTLVSVAQQSLGRDATAEEVDNYLLSARLSESIAAVRTRTNAVLDAVRVASGAEGATPESVTEAAESAWSNDAN